MVMLRQLASKTKNNQNKVINQPKQFHCLNGHDVIASSVSDHHPVIHHEALFWNIMMQGKKRLRRGVVSYNNGFGLEESEQQYIARLIKVAHVIAEIVANYPSIQTIGICEGPIEVSHVAIFIRSLQRFTSMNRFLMGGRPYQVNAENHPNWGLLMLTDAKDQVSKIESAIPKHLNSLVEILANRLHIWKLTRDDQVRYFALAHFPFGGDEAVTERKHLSASANAYSELVDYLLSDFSSNQFTFCGDFNFNPYLIGEWKDRVLDQVTHHNSILLSTDQTCKQYTPKTVTVDGVLLSRRSKQILYDLTLPSMRLLDSLKREFFLFKRYLDKSSAESGSKDRLLNGDSHMKYDLALS
jgi:hypothetical protein